MLPSHPNDSILIPGPGGKLTEVTEMDYCGTLNRCLPDDIRVVGWCEVTDQFSARFSATQRTYRYFFVRGNLDIELMNQAAALLLGEHDFRNFCKMDIVNISNFKREIYHAKIVPFMPCAGSEEDSVYMLQISGIAFLWHMVRCIMAVLFMVGRKEEPVEIVTSLLDVEKIPTKPQYTMAPEQPLVLHECGFDNLTMFSQPRAFWQLYCHYLTLYNRSVIAAAQAKNAMEFMDSFPFRCSDIVKFQDALVSQFNGSLSQNAAASNQGKITGEKRKTIESSGESAQAKEEETMPWSEALKQLRDQHNIIPQPIFDKQHSYSKYVPLLQRPRGDKYEDRVANLSGLKKERHSKHAEMQSKDDVASHDMAFFEKMRKEGTKR